MRTCTQCGETKPLDQFDKAGQGDRLRGNCKACAYKVLKARKARDPDAFARAHRFRVIKHKYTITKDQWENLFAAQDGKCPICLDPVDLSSHVDHDHTCCPGPRSCGECVRGILCGSCNVGIENLKESRDNFLRAMEYCNG